MGKWVTQSCLTLCNPTDCSPSGSSVHGILQARVLEWGAISSSRGAFWPRYWTWVSCIAGGFFTIWATREAWPHWGRDGNSTSLRAYTPAFAFLLRFGFRFVLFLIKPGYRVQRGHYLWDIVSDSTFLDFSFITCKMELLFKNWSIVDLQCCDSFRCTKGCSYTHTHTHIYFSDSFTLQIITIYWVQFPVL